MLTGKERAYLKSLAHNMDPLIQLGKDGINQGFLSQIDKLLEDHEIVKINVLQNAQWKLMKLSTTSLMQQEQNLSKRLARSLQFIGNLKKIKK